MTDDSIRARAIALYDRFTHEHHDRRAFMREMTLLAGSAAAAAALVEAIAASPAAAAAVDPADPRLVTRKGGYAVGGGRMMTGYFAAPRKPGRKVGAVMVIHENRGLNAHTEDVARRVALAGYFAVAPDFLSDYGGTPADEDQAREMIGKVDYDKVIGAGFATLGRLKGLANGNGKAGMVGFCWGGAMVHQVALAAGAGVDAAVSYYGPAPAPEAAARLQAPLMIHLAGNDARVNTTAQPYAAAAKAAGKDVTLHEYAGVEHAFNNDTSAERYDMAAAELAWGRTLAFFERHLA
ncbi:dienelactone hydrolase family protein [Sphingomonas gilva]|uniref:Dienelactone hydrolase family protein n=1 Tax=Sphingomonas gilva TaxID=2305907 RepID=A0A396RQV8_9SPHN|nr:dienelactone hydrolase family protein [Sphingomonas gilva]RHW18898.1 dienelactone hydrolase family protein [Sphingomonas gilva]